MENELLKARSLHRRQLVNMHAALDAKKAELKRVQQNADRETRHMESKCNTLVEQLATKGRQISFNYQCSNQRTRLREELHKKDRGNDAIRMQRKRLKADLTETFARMQLMNSETGRPNANPEVAIAAFFADHPDVLHNVCGQLGVQKAVEERVAEVISTHWPLEVCAAVKVHGNLTNAAMQAIIINILSKRYNLETDRFEHIILPFGTECLRCHLCTL